MSVIDLAETVRLIRWPLGVSLLLGCLEDLAGSRNFKPDGLFSWKVFSTQYAEANAPIIRTVLDRLFGYRGVCVLLYCELAAIFVILVPYLPLSYYLVPVAVVLAIKLALAYRCGYGSDGSDQMEIMVLVGLLSTLCLLSSKAAQLGIWFIALQSALAYLASGISKLFSKSWMTGEAAFKIFNTYTYGIAPVASFFKHVTIASAPACWSIIAYECSFPLSLFAPLSIVWTILILGVLFHAFNALVMGLNKFFWAFVSTYPAIVYCNQEMVRWLVRH